MFQSIRPKVLALRRSKVAVAQPTRLHAFARSPPEVSIFASKDEIATHDHMWSLAGNGHQLDGIAAPSESACLAPVSHKLLSIDEREDAEYPRSELIAISASYGVRSYDLGLDADARPSPLKPIKTCLAQKRGRKAGKKVSFDIVESVDVETPPVDDNRVPSPLKLVRVATPAATPAPQLVPEPRPPTFKKVDIMGATYDDALQVLRVYFRAKLVKTTKPAELPEIWRNEDKAERNVRLAWGIVGSVAAETGDPLPHHVFEELKEATLEKEAFLSSSMNAIEVLKNLEKMFFGGCFAGFDPKAVETLKLGARIRTAVDECSMACLCSMATHAYHLLRFDGGFEHVLSECVREAARRCTFPSWCGSFRCRSKHARAAEISALSSILALVCKNFKRDTHFLSEEEKVALANGQLAESWIHTAWVDAPLFSRHQGEVSSKVQLHFTDAPTVILNIAKFLGSNGSPYLGYFKRNDIAELAGNIHCALSAIKKVGMRELLGDMAAALNVLARDVIKAGTGRKAPEEGLMAALEEVENSLSI